MAKLTTKEVEEIFGIKTAGLPDEQKTFVNALIGAFTDTINKSLTDIPDTDALKEALKPFQSADGITLDSLSKENADLIKQVKSLSDSLDALKKRGIGLDFTTKYNRQNEMCTIPKRNEQIFSFFASFFLLCFRPLKHQLKADFKPLKQA